MPSLDLIEEANRTLTVCNACRYCEGFCAVFPAMEQRRTFNAADLVYLSNLCHNCRGCYYACQYAPPHEFGINVPKTLTQLRAESYGQFAWPNWLSSLFRSNGTKLSWILLASLLMALLLAFVAIDRSILFGRHSGEGAFYAVVPYAVMVLPASILTLFGFLVFAIGLARFWRQSGGTLTESLDLGAHRAALVDALTLRNLGGGAHDDGCNYPDERFSSARRRFHHLTSYGFLLSLASTSVAAIYENLFHWQAPYPYISVPVLLGTVGGISLCIGTIGLFVLTRSSDPHPEDASLKGMDVAFLVSLFGTSFTGLALLAMRETSAMGLLLVVHLGAVLGLFLTMPYGKFVHAIYRYAALVLSHVERSRPAT